MRISQKNRHRKIVEDLEHKLEYANETIERLRKRLLEKSREDADNEREES